MATLKQKVITVLDRLAVAERALGVSRRDVALLYHGVEANPTGYHWSVDVANFGAHLDFLARHFDLAPLEELLAGPRRRSRAAITFDDAYADIYTNVFPLIHERRVPITVFVPTEMIESRVSLLERDGLPYTKSHMTWEQMRELAATGLVRFESHTHSHRLATAHLDRLSEDVARSVALIERHLGHRSRMLAYPYGTWDARTNAAARRGGAQYLFGFHSHPIAGAEVEGRYDICRRNEEFAAFKLTVAGINTDPIRIPLSALRRALALAPTSTRGSF